MPNDTDTTGEAVAHLQQICDNAGVTTGPWDIRTDDYGTPSIIQHDLPSWIVADVLDGDQPDAQFIATFNPTVVRQLLQVVQHAQQLTAHTNTNDSDVITQLRTARLQQALTQLTQATQQTTDIHQSNP